MNKAVQRLLQILSHPEEELDLGKSRKLMNIKTLDPFKLFYRTLDHKFYNGDHEVPVRIYFPSEEAFETVDIEKYRKEHPVSSPGKMEDNTWPVLLFIHGGGFATESVESYNRICWDLAKHTEMVVVSVDYPLAPEFRFPRQLEDCYAVAEAIFTDRSILNVDPENITVMGDSAGGNLTAALCLLARERKTFLPRRQVLLYPCLNNDYSEHTPFASVLENGSDYLLTRKNMVDYLNLYVSCEEDWQNPYFAPLLAEDLTGLPKTLVITAEYDPLRDEGEAFAGRLAEAGVETALHRMEDTIHGFIQMPPLYPPVQEVYRMVREFVKEMEDVSGKENQVEES
ncbi:alpha/beta hydrolase [Cuneatibacter caecimuris]|uniref:Acetyl esterase/lipase n=1 Tax=Cuneatibacter caecimuris TaxID=1796618 RepID=A0A4Q7PL57_9FIRM|nr:acetyl esterase/lipase [Cuneatibacter caecimuris]